MKFIISIACLALAGCGGSPPVPTTPSAPTEPAADTQPAEPEPEAMAETTSAPTLSLEGDGISAPNLPAVSDDGGKVAYLEQYEDGMSGILNARLLILDTATSKPVKEFIILDASEYNDISEIEGDIPGLLEEPNKYLAADSWTSMTIADLGDIPHETPQPIKVGGVSLTFKDGKLSVDGKAVPVKIEDSCGEVYISSAAIDEADKLLLVSFDYGAGGDDCELPGPQYQVVKVP